MTDHFCGGQCAPGYYCPSYILPQPDAPPYTFWPGKPHTRPDGKRLFTAAFIFFLSMLLFIQNYHVVMSIIIVRVEAHILSECKVDIILLVVIMIIRQEMPKQYVLLEVIVSTLYHTFAQKVITVILLV